MKYRGFYKKDENTHGAELRTGLNHYLIDNDGYILSYYDCLCFSSILYVFYEGRSFYSIHKKNFTIWKTYSGCYIMPYRYWGLCKPNKNYLRLSNIGAIDIFILDDSTLSIFPDPHIDGYADIEFHMENSKFYTYTASNGIKELEQSRQWLKLWNEHRSMYPYLSIDAREDHVKVWNYKDMKHIK